MHHYWTSRPIKQISFSPLSPACILAVRVFSMMPPRFCYDRNQHLAPVLSPSQHRFISLRANIFNFKTHQQTNRRPFNLQQSETQLFNVYKINFSRYFMRKPGKFSQLLPLCVRTFSSGRAEWRWVWERSYWGRTTPREAPATTNKYESRKETGIEAWIAENDGITSKKIFLQ